MSKSSETWEIALPSEFICTNNHYLINGKKYARVTRINSIIDKPELLAWYAKNGMDKAKATMKTRADFGSTLHKLIEVVCQGKEIHTENYDALLVKDLELFRAWKVKNKITVEALEQHLWSDKYRYAGTADCVCIIGGKRKILDWKTSRAIYNEYWLQVAAYLMAFEEQTGLKVDGGAGILQIRDGKTQFQEKTRDELIALFEVFKAAMTLFNWKYGDDE